MEDDDNEEGLTHFGQSLGDMEKFDDIQLSDGGEEEGIVSYVSNGYGYGVLTEDISKTHFGGFLKRKKRGVTEEEEEEGEENEVRWWSNPQGRDGWVEVTGFHWACRCLPTDAKIEEGDHERAGGQVKADEGEAVCVSMTGSGWGKLFVCLDSV